MKEKIGAGLVITGLVATIGIAGAVEAKADGMNLGLEVATQTWYTLSNTEKQKYCDTKNVKRIVKVHHKGLGKKSKRELKKSYKLFLKDC